MAAVCGISLISPLAVQWTSVDCTSLVWIDENSVSAERVSNEQINQTTRKDWTAVSPARSQSHTALDVPEKKRIKGANEFPCINWECSASPHFTHTHSPQQLEIAPLRALPFISMPKVNFTACNLHMFILRDLIFLPPCSHVPADSHAQKPCKEKHLGTLTYSDQGENVLIQSQWRSSWVNFFISMWETGSRW